MRLIDWYIIRKFFKVFLFSLFLFTLVAIAIDTSEKIDDFYSSGKNVLEIFVEYYLGFIPFILVLLFPIFIFISVVFFTSRMALRSEITAVRSLGISYTRFLYPYIASGIFFMCIHWAAYNYLLPTANEIRTNFQKKYIDKKNASLSKYYAALYFKDSPDTYVTFKNYDINTRRASPFVVDKIDSNLLGMQVRGASVKWDKDSAKWIARNVVVSVYGSDYRSDIVETKKDTMVLDLAFGPNDAILDVYYKDVLNTPALEEYIEDQRHKGADVSLLELERYKRDATPFSVLLLVILAVLISSRKIRGGSGMHIAFGFVLMALYVLADKFLGSFAVLGNLDPLWAAWFPNIIFALINTYIYRSSNL